MSTFQVRQEAQKVKGVVGSTIMIRLWTLYGLYVVVALSIEHVPVVGHDIMFSGLLCSHLLY